MGLLEHKFDDNVITTSVDQAVAWARQSSLWPMGFGLACCAMEMMAAGGPRSTSARRRGLPRVTAAGRPHDRRGHRDQEDGAQYCGASTTRWPSPSGSSRWAVVRTRAARSRPTRSCRVSSGIELPVDVYIAGCPPRPEALFYGLMRLQDKSRAKPPCCGTSACDLASGRRW